MPKINSLFPTLKLSVILFAAAAITGCAGTQTVSTGSSQTSVASTATPLDGGSSDDGLSSWTVVAGEHLWGIAGEWEVFNLSEKWPLLYKANVDRIDDADLIFPGQVLTIPRDAGVDEIDAAIRHAKTRGAWAVGPIEISDSDYLQSN